MRSRSICSVVSLVHSCSYWRMASERWTWGKGGVGEVMYNGGVDIEEKGGGDMVVAHWGRKGGQNEWLE